MSGHFCKLDKIAAAAAADFKSNLFNGSSNSTNSQLSSMISNQTLGGTAAAATTVESHAHVGAHENRFLASLASMASGGSGLVTASCLTGSTNTNTSRSRSNSITNSGHFFPNAPTKLMSEDSHMSSPPTSSAAASSSSSSSSCLMSKFNFNTSSSGLWSGFNGILRNQNHLSSVETQKLSTPLIPPKSLPLAPSTSTQTSTAASVASALSSAFAPLFIEPSEVMNKIKSNVIILLDCRTWSEFNTTHIKDSVHLNCRDKITRKRLQTRKVTVKDLISCEEVKSKLESNEPKSSSTTTAAPMAAASHQMHDESSSSSSSSIADECPVSQFHRSPSQQSQSAEAVGSLSSNMIVLYDDTTSELEDLQSDANPLKIVQENIKQCGYKKECKILKGGFKEFSKHWPSLCVLKEKSEKLLNAVFCDSQQDQSQSAIENAVMNEIMPHLYLGNEMDAKDEKKLEENGIYYILNVTRNIPFYTSPTNTKFVHKRISVNDCVSQNLKQHFDEAFQFIDEAKKNNSKVLVHCQAGVSRSPTIVIAYLMQTLRLSMNDALNKVRQLRPIVAPNLIFMSQLSDYETRIFTATESKTKVDENVKLTNVSCCIAAKAAVNAVNDDAAFEAKLTQNVNTKSILLLTETNDQNLVEKSVETIGERRLRVEEQRRLSVDDEQDELALSSYSSSEQNEFNFDDFSTDDAEDDQSCMSGISHGHHKGGHHNANEVLVCN